MSVRKRGKAYQVRLPGEKAKSFPTRKAATTYEAGRKVARSLGGCRTPETPVTVAEMLDGCIERWQTNRRPAESTSERATYAVKPLKDELGDRLLTHLTVVEVEDAIGDLAAESPNAAKKAREWWRRSLKDARRRGQQFDPALLELDRVEQAEREGVALTVDELQRLGSWFPEQIALFPEIVGSVGLRLNEALTLEDTRVDVKAGTVFIPAALCKERRDKLIELAPFERQLLAEQLVARPRGTAGVFPRAGGRDRYGRHHEPGLWGKADFYKRVWKPAREAAAQEWRDDHGLSAWDTTPFDRLVPHDLRHTAISRMCAAGMQVEHIAKRVGHKDGGVLILRRYRHLFPHELTVQLGRYDEHVREAVAR